MREIDEKAVKASSSANDLNDFLTEYEPYILKCVSKISGRYIGKSDDEWSVGMSAFCDAVKSYSYDKGSFLFFAEMVIKRRLVDFFRSRRKYNNEYPVSPSLFSGNAEGDGDDICLAEEIAEKTSEAPDSSLRDEIEAAAKELSAYGFSFYDLISCSPKSRGTKKACADAVGYLKSAPILLAEMRRTKNLPLKIIEANAKVPRKILERHRKYIIAATEIITGDYPLLAEYMRSFGKEQAK